MKLRKTHDGKGCASSATARKEPERLSIPPKSAEPLTIISLRLGWPLRGLSTGMIYREPPADSFN